MEDNKNINEKELDNVSGGRGFLELKRRLMTELPLEVRRKLAAARSDNEACAILVESGINYEAIEKEMKDFFAEYNKDLLKLDDKQLEAIVGGFEDEDYGTIKCWMCGTENRDDLSYQFWASTFLTKGRVYRCKKCGHYELVYASRYIECMTEDQYDQWLKDRVGI